MHLRIYLQETFWLTDLQGKITFDTRKCNFSYWFKLFETLPSDNDQQAVIDLFFERKNNRSITNY